MHSAIIDLAQQDPSVAALWLYGSRARGDAGPHSDYDLAILYTDRPSDPLARRLRPEETALNWCQQLNCPEDALSLVDIANCPIPLAWSVLSEGRLLVDKHPGQRLAAEARIQSIWELDYLHDQQQAAN